jgi:endonuclease/exonuclease/phosphatase family metal-dependent hydrolase
MIRLLRSALLAAVLAAPTLLVAGCDSDPVAGATVRVMTQNLYLGGDLFTVVAEQNPQMVPVRVAQLYGTIQASNPAERMTAIAKEIARIRPALVGLQEVSTYYVQSPGDNHTGSPTQATAKTYDFLDLLLNALAAEGVTYTVASRSDNSDVELPATTDGQTFFDVRYRDADVILARSDVSTSGAVETTFQALVTQTVAGRSLTFERAYQSVRATVDGSTFTFVNTHLEVGGQAALIQEAQTSELAPYLRGLQGDVIFVGDINSDAGGTGTQSYATLTNPANKLVDAAGSGAGTPTCCQAADIRNATSALSTRIDVVFSRGFTVLDVDTVLDEAADKTASGLWPSDHAGVWAELQVTGVSS